MQKVIIPALALLIGMALGALLMKNSVQPPKSLNLTDVSDQSKKTIADENLFFTFKKMEKDSFGLIPPDPDSEPITIAEAKAFFEEYIQLPLPAKNSPDLICPNASNYLYGWSVNLEKILEIQKAFPNEMTRFSLLLGRNSGATKDLTLMIVPENDNGELLLCDNQILEYVRPCPPKCKNIVHFYKTDPVTNNMQRTNSKVYSKNQCMTNPFN